MIKRWLRLSPLLCSFLLAPACLPNPESSVQKAEPELSISGRVDQGPVAIYVEQSAAPEVLTADDGSFHFSFDAARLEHLRLQYGLQDPILRLYFIGDDAEALNETVNLQYRGQMDLGLITLQADTPINGRIVANGVPVENARVRLGRKEFLTAVDGTFAGTLPAATATPLLVEKQGFVQTKGSWLPGSASRDVALYSELTPNGAIEVLPQDRSLADTTLQLNYSATGTARFIRFASDAADLAKAYEPGSPWLELGKTLQFTPGGAAVIYYQFADKDQKILSAVLSQRLRP